MKTSRDAEFRALSDKQKTGTLALEILFGVTMTLLGHHCDGTLPRWIVYWTYTKFCMFWFRRWPVAYAETFHGGVSFSGI